MFTEHFISYIFCQLGARVLRNMEETLMDAGVTDNAQLILVIEPKKPESEAAGKSFRQVVACSFCWVLYLYDSTKDDFT